MPNSYGQLLVAMKPEVKEFLSQLAICYFTFHKNINSPSRLIRLLRKVMRRNHIRVLNLVAPVLLPPR